MNYVWKKRLVRLERALSAPLRPGRSGDLCGSLVGVSTSLVDGLRRRALPVSLGVLATCCVVDVAVFLAARDTDAGFAGVATGVSAASAPISSSATLAAAPTASASTDAASAPGESASASTSDTPVATAPVAASASAPTEARATSDDDTVASASRSASRGSRAAVPGVLTEKEVAALLRRAGFGARDVARLTCTARFESGYNPRARNRNLNGTQDSGLFQVNDVWLGPCGVTRAELFDPLVNARCAKKVHDEQGTRAWMAFNERRRICERYRVGDFERKGQRTIRAIVAAHAPRPSTDARFVATGRAAAGARATPAARPGRDHPPREAEVRLARKTKVL